MEQLNSKILLFGEYSVLHNGMALVIPCDKFNGHFEFYDQASDKQFATQSNEYLRKFCGFISSKMDEQFVIEVKRFEKELEQGLFFRSNIPQGYGLGSSGALVSAIVLRYLVKAKELKDDLKVKTFQKLTTLKSRLAELESYFHGVSSGIDPLSIILNEPILYKNAAEIVTADLPHAEDGKNVVFLLDTNQPRTTSTLMSHFNDLYNTKSFKEKFDRYVVEGNNKAIDNFLSNDTTNFYEAVKDISAFQLEEMKAFFPERLQKEVADGLATGTYYLKICGAGGGGFMLGFTQNWEKTQEHLNHYKLEEIYRY